MATSQAGPPALDGICGSGKTDIDLDSKVSVFRKRGCWNLRQEEQIGGAMTPQSIVHDGNPLRHDRFLSCREKPLDSINRSYTKDPS